MATQTITEPGRASLIGTAPWGPDDAPVFILLGQSNSYGHNTILPPDEQITTGLQNVHTLSQAKLYNTSFTTISWTGLTTLGDANIGPPVGSPLGNQNHPVNAANRLARLWQDHISGGNKLGLPDLYVVLMGYGSQGIYLGNPVGDRWSPDRDNKDVDSLYPRALRTLRLAMHSLRAMGKHPRIIAVHWNQWETEAVEPVSAKASTMNFSRIIAGINDALGSPRVPWRFFYPLSLDYLYTAMVEQATASIVAGDPDYRTVLDPRQAPHYTGVSPNFGIFGGDNVHYLAATHEWFAQQEWAAIEQGYKGVELSYPVGHIDQYWLEQERTTLANRIDSLTGTTGGTPSPATSPPAAYPPVVQWYPALSAYGTWIDAASNQAGLLFKDSASVQSAWKVAEVGGRKAYTAVALAKKGAGGQSLAIFNSLPSDAKYGGVELDLFCDPCPDLTVCFRINPTPLAGTLDQIGYGYVAVQLSCAYVGKPQYMPANIPLGSGPADAKAYVMVWNLAAGNVIQSLNFASATTADTYTGTPVFSVAYAGQPMTVCWPTKDWSRWRIGIYEDGQGTLKVEYYDARQTVWHTLISQQNMDAVLVNGLSAGQFGLLAGMSSLAATVDQQNSLYQTAFKDIVFHPDD